jgi:hypothetical protein
MRSLALSEPSAEGVMSVAEHLGAASESKREAFKRLAERRTNAAMDRIRVIGNLSNPYAYEYTDEDVRLIFAALEQELKATRLKFRTSKRREFKLG